MYAAQCRLEILQFSNRRKEKRNSGSIHFWLIFIMQTVSFG
jgi:hypothetical protein